MVWGFFLTDFLDGNKLIIKNLSFYVMINEWSAGSPQTREHFYDMKNRFWAVGCGLGWAVE